MFRRILIGLLVIGLLSYIVWIKSLNWPEEKKALSNYYESMWGVALMAFLLLSGNEVIIRLIVSFIKKLGR